MAKNLLRISLLLLASGLLLPRCSEDAGDDARFHSTRGVTLELPELEAGVAVFVDGRAALGIEARTAGSVVLEVEEDGAATRTSTVDVLAGGSTSLPLPGEGLRALRLKLGTQGGAELVAAELRDRIVESRAKPAASALAGIARNHDVLLVLADALSARSLGCYGSTQARTPHIDRLAAEGILFERALSQTSWTVPSVISLFTGLEQERHGVRDVGRTLPVVPTLADVFAASGYRTEAFVQNGLLTEAVGLARGFSSYEVFDGERRDALPRAVLERVSRIEGEPRFTYVHYLPPHEPYRPPERFAAMFGADLSDPLAGTSAHLQRVNAARPRAGQPGVLALERLYDANVAHVDEWVGELLDAVARNGRDTLVVFAADHGEAMAEHGFVGHNVHVYEEMVHVPWILWSPALSARAGTRVRTPVSLLDLRPTLEALCDLSALEHARRSASVDRLPWIDEPDRETGNVLHLSARYVTSKSETGEALTAPLQTALVAGPFKWIRERDGREALHDLRDDPGEHQDRSREWPVLLRAFQSEHRTWQAQNTAAAGEFEVDETLRAELERLGYLRSLEQDGERDSKDSAEGDGSGGR